MDRGEGRGGDKPWRRSDVLPWERVKRTRAMLQWVPVKQHSAATTSKQAQPKPGAREGERALSPRIPESWEGPRSLQCCTMSIATATVTVVGCGPPCEEEPVVLPYLTNLLR